MTSRKRNLFVILLIAGMLIVSAVIIATQPTKLGLDLKGGIELVYQAQATADSKVTNEAMASEVDQVREGCDALGISETEVQRLGTDQLSVGIPGAKDAARAARQCGKPARLYMYDFAKNVIPPKVEPGSNSTVKENTAPYKTQYEAVVAASKQKPVVDDNNTTPCSTPDTPEKCQQYYLFGKEVNGQRKLLSGPDVSRKDLLSQFNGKVPAGAVIETVPVGTVVVQAPATANTPKGTDPGWFVLRDDPEIKGTQLDSPKAAQDEQTGGQKVTFQFKNGGAEDFQRVTKRLVDRALTDQIPGQPVQSQSFAIVLDRVIESKPVVDPERNPGGIDGRSGAEISGDFSVKEAQDLAKLLERGGLPLNLKLISQTQVSASLGKQALHEGLIAGGIGLLIVVLFLLLFYRILGVIAVLALAVYGIFFLALIKLFGITLTLPGIAGLILTIGVAADANIVIFERIKEELRAGKPPLSALATGYARGIRTIIDANVVTLITALILFVLATAGVKGFAFTLMIGTAVSFLTAVLFTQAVLGTMGRSRVLQRPSALGAGERRFNWRFDYVGTSKYFFALSGVILVICSVGLATRGLNFGIDFEGGSRTTVNLAKPATTEEVRKALAPIGLGDAKVQQVDNPKLGDNVFQVSIKKKQVNQAKLDNALDDKFGISGAPSSESIGPTFGESVAQSAIYAVIFSLALIMIYVAFRFSAKFSVPVMIALLHDILITIGVYALVGRELTAATVAAFLTILGYSLYDTVIVFDRIRENTPRMPRAAFSQIVNRSMSEVLTRSLATSFCTLLPILALLFFGGATLQDFAFALMVGVLSGTYSSVFIASPVLTESVEREPAYRQRRRRIKKELGVVPPYAADVRADAPQEVADRDEEVEEDLEELESLEDEGLLEGAPDTESQLDDAEDAEEQEGEAEPEGTETEESSSEVEATTVGEQTSTKTTESQPKRKKQSRAKRRKQGKGR